MADMNNNPTWPAVQATSSQHPMTTRAATATWLLLMAATLLSWWLAKSAGAEGGDHTGELTAIVALAVLKMYLVLAVFMGLWKSPLNWHTALGAWLLGTGGLILYFALQP